MTEWKSFFAKNSNRLDVLEGKINIILVLIGGQFLGVFGLIITVLTLIF